MGEDRRQWATYGVQGMRMRTQWAGRYRSLLVSVIGWALGLFLITACGTLELGVEATLPASSTRDATPVVEPTGGPSPTAPVMVSPTSPGQMVVTPSPLVSTPAPSPLTPSPLPTAANWRERPPGLVYRDLDALWRINGDEEPVTIGNAGDVLSPDGKWLLAHDFNSQETWLHDLGGGPSRPLGRIPEGRACCFRWWPSRPDTILFNSAPLEGAPQPGQMGYLTLLDLRDGVTQILDPEHDTGPTTFSPSPDGRTIAYGGGQNGWLVELDDGSQHTPDPTPFRPADYGLAGFADIQLASPSWSPDGTRLAWMVRGTLGATGEHQMAIAVFDLATSTARLLHPYEPMGGGWPEAPVWSPDGQWLAFAAGPVNLDEAGVWVVQSDGQPGEAHRFGWGGTPVWSPGGDWLAFISISPEGVPGMAAAQRAGPGSASQPSPAWQVRPINLPPGGNAYLMEWVSPVQ